MAELDSRPIGARVGLDMIGSACGEQVVKWTERDTMLYALGVGAGAGDPECDLGFTTENTRGVRLQALPSFLTIMTMAATPPALRQLDVGRCMHAEQEIELLQPLPAVGEATLTAVVESVLDKGEGAIVTTRSTLRLGGSDGDVLGHGRMGTFVRGAGGFGGPRGSASKFALPDRAPDLRITYESRVEQALLYRLSGDRHRLHSDPLYARERQLDRPILHGLCTYGFACRALIEAIDGDPTRLLSMRARFRKPVYPGEALTTTIWRDAPDVLLFRTLDSAGDAVIEHGVARSRTLNGRA